MESAETTRTSAMSAGRPTLEQSVCWECGEPADPRSVYIQVLTTSSRRHADNLGFPVKRGWLADTLQVPIPRCEKCRNLQYLYFGLILGCPLMALAAAIALFPHIKWSGLVGGASGLLLAVGAITMHRRRRCLRSTCDYPPLRQLIKQGWSAPD